MTSLSGTVTYDYTPAAPAPAIGSDPITVALMGVTFGLFVLSGPRSHGAALAHPASVREHNSAPN